MVSLDMAANFVPYLFLLGACCFRLLFDAVNRFKNRKSRPGEGVRAAVPADGMRASQAAEIPRLMVPPVKSAAVMPLFRGKCFLLSL